MATSDVTGHITVKRDKYARCRQLASNACTEPFQ